MNGYWQGQRVLVAGGSGFVGSHLVERLLELGAQVRVVGREKAKFEAVVGPQTSAQVEFVAGNLVDPEFAQTAVQGMDQVFNLAAYVAGIGYNSTHPGTMFTNNVMPGVTLLDAAARSEVERFLVVSSACVYPRYVTIPTPEVEGFQEDPEPTNMGYGWSKRTLEVQARLYAQEFPMQIGIARPYNIYGPRDNFDWEKSHVIPALIRKVLEGQNPLKVWGDGTQTRAFLYVTDVVEGLLHVIKDYPQADAVNIGTDEEVTIGHLAHEIVRLSGLPTTIEFDTSAPKGQPRRNGDFTKANQHLTFRPQVNLAEGLARTIAWYKEVRGF